MRRNTPAGLSNEQHGSKREVGYHDLLRCRTALLLAAASDSYRIRAGHAIDALQLGSAEDAITRLLTLSASNV